MDNDIVKNVDDVRKLLTNLSNYGKYSIKTDLTLTTVVSRSGKKKTKEVKEKKKLKKKDNTVEKKSAKTKTHEKDHL